MRAVTIKDGNLSVEDHPDPVPGAGEVLVRVKAAGLNGADMMQRRGFYPAPPGAPRKSPGWSSRARSPDWARVRLGSALGDRVMGIVGGGGQAELAVVHERILMPVPDNLDWARQAASPRRSRPPTTACSPRRV